MSQPHLHRLRAKRGFALILSLGLMALMVLLTLTLSAMIGVEAESARQSQLQSVARQNAQLAVYQALGIIQNRLGPDRVVTARAEILGASVAHPLWTGVWSATNTSSAPVWLVSGVYSTTSRLLSATASSNMSFTEPVVIYKAISSTGQYKNLHNQGTGTVTVGRMAISANDLYQGGYAWWVSDEGVKASIARVSPVLMDESVEGADDVSAKELRHARQYAQTRAGLEDAVIAEIKGTYDGSLETQLYSTATPSNKLRWLDRVPNAAALNRVDNELFPLGNETSPGVTWFEHDLTGLSMGVMANPAAPAGQPSLKIDLSTALRNTWTGGATTVSMLANLSVSMPTAASQAKWDKFAPALSAYFNLWRIAENARGVSVNGVLTQVPLIAPVYYGASLSDYNKIPNIADGTPIFSNAPVLTELYFTFAGYLYDQDSCQRRLSNGTRDAAGTCSGADQAFFCTNVNHISDPYLSPAGGDVFNLRNVERPFEFRSFGFSEYWNPYTADVRPPNQGFFQIRIKGLPKLKINYYSVPSPNTQAKEKSWQPFTSVSPFGSLFSTNESEDLDFQERLKSPAPLGDYLAIDLKLPAEEITLGAGEMLPWGGLASTAPGYKTSGSYSYFSTLNPPSNSGNRATAVYGIREQQSLDYNHNGAVRNGGKAIPNYHGLGLCHMNSFYPSEARAPWIGRVNGLSHTSAANQRNVRLRFSLASSSPKEMEAELWWVPTSGSGTPNDGNAVFFSSYKMTMPSFDIGPTEGDGAEFWRLSSYSLDGRFGWYFLRKDALEDPQWLTKTAAKAQNNMIQDVDQFMFYQNGTPADVRMDSTSWNQPASWASLGLLDKRSGILNSNNTNLSRTSLQTAVVKTSNIRIPKEFVNLPERDLGAAVSQIELPTRRPISMGSLQHLTLANRRPFSIGNSWGFKMGPSGQADVNELFDDFGISGLSSVDISTLDLDKPLLNQWLHPLWTRSSAPASVDSTNILGYFMTKGAFNLNSTSITAWKSMLSGIWADSWDYADASVNGTRLDAQEGKLSSLKRAHFRYAIAGDETFVAPDYVNSDSTGVYKDKDPGMHPNHFRRGVRTLSPAQITTISQSIVRQLQVRQKPFTSIADFLAPVGRSEGGKSILEQAIEDAGVNTGTDWSVQGTAGAAPMPGSSAYLTQADLLTSMAPFLQARSDTFKIRAYGDVKNAAGQVEARAICEATVQRYPDPVDVSGTYQTPGNNGRQFKIVSMRWINE